MAQAKVDKILACLLKAPEVKVIPAASQIAASLVGRAVIGPFNKYLPQNNQKLHASIVNNAEVNKSLDSLGLTSAFCAVGRNKDQWDFSSCVKSLNDAYRDTVSTLMSLVPYIYESNLDSALDTEKLGTLKELASQSDVKEAFYNTITDLDFLARLKPLDGATQSYRMNLIFVNEYFHTGTTPSLSSTPKSLEQGGKSFLNVLKKWMESVKAPTENKTFMEVITAFLKKDGSKILNPGQFGADLLEIIQSTGAVYSVHTLVNEWESQIATLMGGVQKAQAEQNQWTEPFYVEHHTKIPYETKHYRTYTEYGGSVSGWFKVYEKSGYVAHLPYVDKTRSFSDRKAGKNGCFRPGTLVWLDGEQKPIEELAESDQVLTRADTHEYGYTSDERVEIHSTEETTLLWGFNDDQPFFTANHVFMTTTGYRAIDPITALEENPWLNVGLLEAGHILLRTVDGVKYDNYVIDRVHCDDVPCKTVYNVHLREGLRSYHANGFLVYLNYPEITIKSVAKILRSFSPENRLHMLSCFDELQPMFRRFGIGTVREILERELHDDIVLESMRTPLHKKAPFRGLEFTSRAFSLGDMTDTPNKTALPQLELHQGVLYVDGSYCKSANIEKSSFMWSRLLKDSNLWEFGLCMFETNIEFTTGDGYIWYETEEAPATPKSEPRQISVQAVEMQTVYPEWAQVADGQTLEMPKPTLIGDEEVETFGFSAPTSVDQASVGFSVGGFAASDSDAKFDVGKSDASAESALVDEPEFHVDLDEVQGEGDANPPKELLVKLLDESPPSSQKYTRTDKFRLSFENMAYQEGEVNNISQALLDPLPFLDMEFGNTGDEKDPKMATYTFPQLDLLAKKVLEQLGVKNQNMDPISFYSCSARRETDGTRTVIFSFKESLQLALAADNNDDGDGKVRSWKNLTFKKLGLDLQLKFVPIQGFCKLNATGTESTQGLIREYDPDMVGGSGARHLLQAILDKNAAKEMRQKAAEEATKGPLTTSHEPVKVPWVTKPTDVKSLTYLLNKDADTPEIKKETDRLLEKAMLYHMKTEDRELFTSKAQPVESDTAADGIPKDLASGLHSDLKTWLQEKYAVGWIVNMITQQDDVTKSAWNIKLDKKGLRKMFYFWTGTGAKCMGQSKEYMALNEIAGRLAFRKTAGWINTFVEDISQTGRTEDEKKMDGGTMWANRLYNYLVDKNNGQLKQLHDSLKETEKSKFNLLERHCSVLNALSSTSKTKVNKECEELSLSSALSQAAKIYTDAETVFEPDYTRLQALVDDCKLEYMWLYNAMKVLTHKIMGQESGFDTGIWAKLRAEFAKWSKAVEDGKADWAKREVDVMLQSISGSIKEVARGLNPATKQSVLKGLTAVGKGIGSGLKAAYKAIKNIFGRAQQQAIAAEAAIAGGAAAPPLIAGQPKPIPSKSLGAIGIVATIAATGFYIFTSWGSFKGLSQPWDELDYLQKVERVNVFASLAQAIVGNVYGMYQAVKVLKGWATPGQNATEARNLAFKREILAAGRAQAQVARRASVALNNGELELQPRRQGAEQTRATIQERLTQRNTREAAALRVNGGGMRGRANSISQCHVNVDREAPITRPRSPSVPKSEVPPKKGVWAAAREKFTLTEIGLRALVIVVACIIFVVSTMLYIESWKQGKLNTAAKVIGGLMIATQVAMIVVDIIAIFACVSPYVILALVVVNIILGILHAIYGGPPPPKSPVQEWWEKTGSKFLNDLDDPPLMRFDWQVTPTQIKEGETTLVTVTGTWLANDTKMLPRLLDIQVKFSSGPNMTSVLFDTGSNFTSAGTNNETPNANQFQITVPSSPKADHDIVNLGDQVVPNYDGKLISWALIVKGIMPDTGYLSDTDYYHLNTGDKIVFQMKGKITPKKNEKLKQESSEYTIRIIENYANVEGEQQEALEDILKLSRE